MEEIALVVSSIAGACTAVALDKIPRGKQSKQITVNSAIDNQLNSLKIEREILTKTISRVNQEDSNITKIQRDKLLIRYQHQLSSIIAKIEKLENANKYPDLGPIGDSLINLMDTKLSKFDQRLHEISSKLTVDRTQTVIQPSVLTQSNLPSKQQEQTKQVVLEKPRIEKLEIKTEAHEEKKEIQKENIQPPIPLIEIPVPERRRSVELSTLTEIPSKMPEFPAEFIKPIQTQVEVSKTIIEHTKDSSEQPKQIVPVVSTSLANKESSSVPLELPKLSAEQTERKIQLPTPIKIPEEEKIEDDDKDLDKIKSEIMRALSKLEQVEVE